MKKIFLSKSFSQTKKIGENLAKRLLKKKISKGALIIALEGDLGGGKTTFLQGFAKGCNIKERVLSPTFIIMRKFKINFKNIPFKYLYHFDCYRVKKPKEIIHLNFKEIIKNPENIVAIEWAENIKKILPKKILKIKFKFINKNTRKLVIEDNFNLWKKQEC